LKEGIFFCGLTTSFLIGEYVIFLHIRHQTSDVFYRIGYNLSITILKVEEIQLEKSKVACGNIVRAVLFPWHGK